MFLEELADTAPEADCTTQTDEFLERPPTPAFVPVKLGVDCATQIEHGMLVVMHFARALHILAWAGHSNQPLTPGCLGIIT